MSILRRLVTSFSFGPIRMVNLNHACRRTYCEVNGPVVTRSSVDPHRIDVSGRLNVDKQPTNNNTVASNNNTVGWAQVILLLIAGSMTSLWARKNYMLECKKHAYETSKDRYDIWRDLAEDRTSQAVVPAAVPSQSAAAAPPPVSAAITPVSAAITPA